MRLDWADLRIFLHVCDAGSMTAAAARCHLTLAAVSARVRNLEEANGLVLLQRRARGVAPTAAGEVLAAHARLVFEQIQQLERDLLHGRSQAPAGAVLLANSSALARPLAHALARCAGDDQHGGRLTVRESASEATVHALRSGAADVGIVSDAVDTRGLAVHALGPDPLALVVPHAHALARLGHTRFRDALDHPWVLWGDRSALSTHLRMRALALDARIDARFTYPALDGVLALVAAGAGVTVLPEAVLDRASAQQVARIALDEPWAQRRLLVCHAHGGRPHHQLVASIVQAWAAA